MSDPRDITLMLFDQDRYFIDGVQRLIQERYPHVVTRSETRQVNKVDVLLTGMDAVSLCASREYMRMMTAESQLLVVHEPHELCWQGLPPALQRCRAQYLNRRQSLQQLARRLQLVIPDKRCLVRVIDPRAVREDILTPREKTFIAHLRVHLNPHQIAASMALHPKTISTYKRSVMLKLGMQKNLELYHWLFYSSVSEEESV